VSDVALWPPPEAWPANILRFHLVFPAPMDTWRAMEHVVLEDAAGCPIEGALLDLEHGLWSRDLTVLTVLRHPARLKTGLESAGPVLQPGEQVGLRLRSGWLRADGVPLGRDVRHPIRIVAAVTTPVTLPDALHPATPDAPLPLDCGRPLDILGVAAGLGLRDAVGRSCPFLGEPTARGLLLHPLAPWPAGPLRPMAGTELEDVCGNRVGLAFERQAA
jgi:hypothetical protein